MSCRQFRPLLSAYADCELVAVDRLRVRQHLLACEDCASELKMVLGVRQLVAELPSGPEPRLGFEAMMAKSIPAAPSRIAFGFALFAAAAVATLLIPAMVRPGMVQPAEDARIEMNREVARERMISAEADPTSGASLVHLADFAGH